MLFGVTVLLYFIKEINMVILIGLSRLYWVNTSSEYLCLNKTYNNAESTAESSQQSKTRELQQSLYQLWQPRRNSS